MATTSVSKGRKVGRNTTLSLRTLRSLFSLKLTETPYVWHILAVSEFPPEHFQALMWIKDRNWRWDVTRGVCGNGSVPAGTDEIIKPRLISLCKEQTIPPNFPKASRCRGNPVGVITVTFLWPGAGTTTAAGCRSLSPWSSSLLICSFRSSLSFAAYFLSQHNNVGYLTLHWKKERIWAANPRPAAGGIYRL